MDSINITLFEIIFTEQKLEEYTHTKYMIVICDMNVPGKLSANSSGAPRNFQRERLARKLIPKKHKFLMKW